MGTVGEFLNAPKEFELGKKKKGIKIQPGHAVAVTAMETLDFRRETVHKLFPEDDLHAIVSPTTDLSREGIVAPTTQVDAGFYGTLNWTLTNTSNAERRFLYRERIYRLTIFRLGKGEAPDCIYEGDYQGQMGYVRSQRKGAPTGMREDEWEDSVADNGPEQVLENLLKSGYPWHALGQRLKIIDQQFKSVSDEYSEIHDTLDRLRRDVDQIRESQISSTAEINHTVASAISEQSEALQNRWLIVLGSMLVGLCGLALTVASNDTAKDFFRTQGWWFGLVLVVGGVVALIMTARRTQRPKAASRS